MAAMSITSSPTEWADQELAGLKAAYDLGSAPGDAVTKYNPTPGEGGRLLGSGARCRRGKLGRHPPGVPLPPAPRSAHLVVTSSARTPLSQAAGASATSLCPPTTTPFTATTKNMCRSCKLTADSCRVRLRGPATQQACAHHAGMQRTTASPSHRRPPVRPHARRVEAHVPPHVGAGRGGPAGCLRERRAARLRGTGGQVPRPAHHRAAGRQRPGAVLVQRGSGCAAMLADGFRTLFALLPCPSLPWRTVHLLLLPVLPWSCSTARTSMGSRWARMGGTAVGPSLLLSVPRCELRSCAKSSG